MAREYFGFPLLKRSMMHSPKVLHYWNLTIRLFNVISRTLIAARGGGFLALCREAVDIFYSPSRLGKPMEAFWYDPQKDYPEWSQEEACRSTGRCLGGKVILKTIQESLELLKNLLSQDTQNTSEKIWNTICFSNDIIRMWKTLDSLQHIKCWLGKCYPLRREIFFHHLKNLVNLCRYILWVAIK